MCCQSFMVSGDIFRIPYSGRSQSRASPRIHRRFTTWRRIPSARPIRLRPSAWKAQPRLFRMLLQPLRFSLTALRAGPIESRVKRLTVASCVIVFGIGKVPGLGRVKAPRKTFRIYAPVTTSPLHDPSMNTAKGCIVNQPLIVTHAPDFTTFLRFTPRIEAGALQQLELIGPFGIDAPTIQHVVVPRARQIRGALPILDPHFHAGAAGKSIIGFLETGPAGDLNSFVGHDAANTAWGAGGQT